MDPVEQAKLAGKEVADLINLLLDDVSNKDQLTQFLSDGFQAVQALAAVGIPTEHKFAVAWALIQGIVSNVKVG